jgi:BR serine/threonine kinase
MSFGPNSVGDYILGDTIGAGTTAKVKLACHKSKGDLVAVKIIKKSLFDAKPRVQSRVQREIALMRLLDHPNLLKLIDFRETPSSLYLLLEYAAHGELFGYIGVHGRCPEPLAMNFFRQIVYGVDYLHSHAICHRDLKPENILLDEFDNVHIADFGFARWMKSNIAETACGSPHYASPEVIRGRPYDGRAADVWSCGVILYAMLAGRVPFDDPSIRGVLAKVKSGRYVMPSTFSQSAQDLISKILVVDPQRRISIRDIKNHPAFRVGLPDDYVVPRPIPIHWDRTPVPAREIDSETMDILRAIGFPSDDVVMRELESPDLSMAKVFFSMYKRRQSIEELPWTAMSPTDSPIVPAGFQHSPDLMAMSQEQAADAFAGYQRPVGGAPKRFSYSATDMWSSPQPASSLELVERFENIPITIERLLTIIQKTLSEQGYHWFHPNPMLLIGHNKDRNKFFILKPVPQTKQVTTLKLIVPVGSTTDYALSSVIAGLVHSLKMAASPARAEIGQKLFARSGKSRPKTP